MHKVQPLFKFLFTHGWVLTAAQTQRTNCCCVCLSFLYEGRAGVQQFAVCEVELQPSGVYKLCICQSWASVSTRSLKKCRAGTFSNGEYVLSASSIINRQPVVTVFPPAARCFRLHGRRLWTQVRSKRKKRGVTAQLFVHDSTFVIWWPGVKNVCLPACGYLTCCPSFSFFFRLGKLQDSQKKLRIGPWRSRSGSAVWPSATFWR